MTKYYKYIRFLQYIQNFDGWVSMQWFKSYNLAPMQSWTSNNFIFNIFLVRHRRTLRVVRVRILRWIWRWEMCVINESKVINFRLQYLKVENKCLTYLMTKFTRRGSCRIKTSIKLITWSLYNLYRWYACPCISKTYNRVGIQRIYQLTTCDRQLVVILQTKFEWLLRIYL